MSQKDRCIKCDVETPYHMDVNIEYRNFYIEGAGQLCKECYDDLFEEEHIDEEE